MAYSPCRNPNCPHYGSSHPNCKCPPLAGYEKPGVTTNNTQMMAEGGSVCPSHTPDCPHYADGGSVLQQPTDPEETLNESISHGGLLNVFKNLGKAGLTNFASKHHTALHSVKDPNTKLGKHFASGNYDKAAGSLQGSPLVGQISGQNLSPMLQQLHPAMQVQEPHPEGFRSAVNYLNSAKKGSNSIQEAVSSLFDAKKIKGIQNKGGIKPLSEHIDALTLNPSAIIDIGGNVGHYLPDHTAPLGALAGRVVDYMNTIKPKNTSTGPLNNPIPPSKSAEASYNRQLSIAEQPLQILEHVKNGTLIPQDLTTLTTLYPKLYQKLVSSIGQSFIDGKKEIPYQLKMSLSSFMGQPLDATLTQPGMQAALMANTPKAPPQPPGKKKPSSETALKQQEKNNSLFETETQATASKS